MLYAEVRFLASILEYDTGTSNTMSNIISSNERKYEFEFQSVLFCIQCSDSLR